jgi:hypothetical protein|tara:strand:+ start:530 stop:931 length:402 start_codon:yes stop_codon:yes gene_type:complete
MSESYISESDISDSDISEYDIINKLDIEDNDFIEVRPSTRASERRKALKPHIKKRKSIAICCSCTSSLYSNSDFIICHKCHSYICTFHNCHTNKKCPECNTKIKPKSHSSNYIKVKQNKPSCYSSFFKLFCYR